MVLATALVIAMLLLMNAEVGSRYLFGFSTQVSDEYGGYLFAALTVLCMLPALRSGRFLRIEGLLRYLPLKVQALLEVIGGLCGAVISGALAWQTYLLTEMNYELGTVSIQASQTPQYIPMAILPLCFGILSLGFIEYGLTSAQRRWHGEPLSASAGDHYVVD
jgi:TRAP-type C4-dicarboxylate transport system permease small subunit